MTINQARKISFARLRDVLDGQPLSNQRMLEYEKAERTIKQYDAQRQKAAARKSTH